jgi:hypothetical protein
VAAKKRVRRTAKRPNRARPRAVAAGIAVALAVSALGIWALWRTTRPPADAPLHLPAPLSGPAPLSAPAALPPVAPEAPAESIDAAERARLDALIKKRGKAPADVSRRSR